MLTKKELGIPFVLGDNGTIRDDKGNLIVVVNDKRYDDFILLAANNYHALVEALEKHDEIFLELAKYRECITMNCLPEVVKLINDGLATHTQEEAAGDESKDTAHTAINDK